MSQPPISVKLALPPKPGFPGRTGVVQVLQARAGSGGQAIIQQRSPGFKQIATIRPFSPPASGIPINTNTAIQYPRKPIEMTIINPGGSYVPAGANTGFGGFHGQGINLGAGGLQPMLSGPGVLPGGMGSFPGSPGNSSLASSRKPCNCTKSHCLKLYCECFAQGQLCQNCNCNNCMNNLAYEDERGRAIKMTLERNPTAFHPKIGRGEGERKHTKGCNCKRSGCLKNYCECYEAKISCSDLCRCQGCRNTEDSIERRSLMRLAAMGSLKSRQPASFKKHLVKPPPETLPHVFLTWEVIEATMSCLLAQADDAERRDLPPAAQERIILEEFGRSVERVIESASKAQVRSIASGGMITVGSGAGDLTGGGSGRGVVGAAAAASAAAAVLLGDDDDEDEEPEEDEDDDGLDGVVDDDDGLEEGELDDMEDEEDVVDQVRREAGSLRHHRALAIDEMAGGGGGGRTTPAGRTPRSRGRQPRAHIEPEGDPDDDLLGGGVRGRHLMDLDLPSGGHSSARGSVSLNRRRQQDAVPDDMDSGPSHRQQRHRFVSASRGSDRYVFPSTPRHSHHTRRSTSHHHGHPHDEDF